MTVLSVHLESTAHLPILMLQQGHVWLVTIAQMVQRRQILLVNHMVMNVQLATTVQRRATNPQPAQQVHTIQTPEAPIRLPVCRVSRVNSVIALGFLQSQVTALRDSIALEEPVHLPHMMESLETYVQLAHTALLALHNTCSVQMALTPTTQVLPPVMTVQRAITV